jgi:hypothetical protein
VEVGTHDGENDASVGGEEGLDEVGRTDGPSDTPAGGGEGLA